MGQDTPRGLEEIDYAAFRRRLAGLADAEAPLAEEANAEMRILSADLACLLAELFGEELERKTLWARIDSAMKTACAKVADGDLELFVSHCLEHVKADAGRASGSGHLARLLSTLTGKPLEWRLAFTRYVQTRGPAVLVHGRTKWDLRRAEIRDERGGV